VFEEGAVKRYQPPFVHDKTATPLILNGRTSKLHARPHSLLASAVNPEMDPTRGLGGEDP